MQTSQRQTAALARPISCPARWLIALTEVLAKRQRAGEGRHATTMICILKTDRDSRGHWYFATDLLDARRQAEASDEQDLVAALDGVELDRAQGVVELPTGHVLFHD